MKKLFIILTIAFTLFSCENVNIESPIPEMAVQLSFNIMQDAPELNVIGGYKNFISATTYGQYLGYGGIVVFHGFMEEFYAFDLACPYEIKNDVRVEVNMAGVGECPQCGTQYDVGFGSGTPSSGPSAFALKKYKVLVSGYNLRVVR